MNDKQQKILQMAKDICRVKLNCNDVCNPISACDALKYAERAVEAGYSKQSGWISVAERFESKINCIPQHHFTLAAVLFDLDKLVKEMTEK